jgi:hypothetical protein
MGGGGGGCGGGLAPSDVQKPPGPKVTEVDRIAGVPIYEIDNGPDKPRLISFVAGLAVDADGSPNAYHPDNKDALDDLKSAARRDKDRNPLMDPQDPSKYLLNPDIVAFNPVTGKPHIQGKNDPYPGYYVSMTSYQNKDPNNKDYPKTDPRRYLDATQIPYVVINPALKNLGVQVGDLGMLSMGDRRVFVVVGDVGPKDKLGEGSIKAVDRLGGNPNAIKGGIPSGVRQDFFPGRRVSAPAGPLTANHIAIEGSKLANQLGWERGFGNLPPQAAAPKPAPPAVKPATPVKPKATAKPSIPENLAPLDGPP